MKNIIIIAIGIVVIISGAYFLLNNSGEVIDPSKLTGPPVAESPTPTPTPITIPTLTPTQTPAFKSTLAPNPIPTPTSVATPTPLPTPTLIPIPIPTTHNVSIQNFAFSQKSITIKNGDIVVWTNKDSASHTVTGDSGSFSSPTLNINGIYSFTFNNVGTFSYYCAFHPSMKGTVVVTQ